MSAFDQTDFSNRCQRLIDLCQKAYIALASQHPDCDKRLSEVSKDWVDFYLSHGKRDVQPPNMTFVSPEIWERNINELGVEFGHFIHKKVDSKTFQNIILSLSMFKNEEKLTQLHNSLKAANLCERQLNKIENIDLWLDTRLLIPYNLLYDYENSFPDIVVESNIDVEEHLDSIKILKENINENGNLQETQQLIFDSINENIDQTLAKWSKRYYYQ